MPQSSLQLQRQRALLQSARQQRVRQREDLQPVYVSPVRRPRRSMY